MLKRFLVAAVVVAGLSACTPTGSESGDARAIADNVATVDSARLPSSDIVAVSTSEPVGVDWTGTLRPGEALRDGAGGGNILVHQHDGNVVIYNVNSRPLWSTRTQGTPTSRLAMQGDGNLVLYDTSNRPVWHTKTNGTGAKLSLQGDANAVLYDNGKVVWAAFHWPPKPKWSVDGAITMYFGSADTWLGAQARRVVQCESQGNTNAVSPTNDHGIFQINKPSHYSNFPRVTGSPFYNGVYDPYENAQYARYLYNNQGWGPWTCRP